MKKLIVFLGSALITLWPSVRNFNFAVKKKLNEGPGHKTINNSEFLSLEGVLTDIRRYGTLHYY